MGIFRQFPYSNFHELNLDWIMRHLHDLEKEWADFEVDWSKDVEEQVNKWLEEHPEATTTVQDDSLTTAKYKDQSVTFEKLNNDALNDIYDGKIIYDVEGVPIEQHQMRASYGRQFVSRKPIAYYTNDANYVYIQSAVYIDTVDHFILGFCTKDSSFSMLVEVESDFLTIVRRTAGMSLGHVNDLTFNPNTNKIYCAVMSYGAYANKLVEIDYTSLAITGAIAVADDTVYQVSYDQKNKVYFIGTHTNGIYDENFNLIKEFAKHDISAEVGEPIVDQGSTIINDTYILAANHPQRYYLTSYRWDTGDIDQIQEYHKIYWYDEVEAIAAKAATNELYVFSGQRYVTVLKSQTNIDSADVELASMFNNGIEIPADSDLNDYYQTGKYFVRSGTTAATITNIAPKCNNRASTLYVFTLGYDSLMQIQFGSSAAVIAQFRTRIGANEWGAWTDFTSAPTQQSIGGPVDLEGGTVQIPTAVLNSATYITICFTRGTRAGSVTLPAITIRNGEAADGVCIMARNDRYWNFTISATGLITITGAAGTNAPYVRIISA